MFGHRKSNIWTPFCLSAFIFGAIAPTHGFAANWTPLANLMPSGSAGTMMLLTDGTVMVQSGGKTWARLTPDANGNYANGTWSALAPMSLQRLYFASQVLPTGKVWVLGGEYSGPGLARNDSNLAEIYDPTTNSWSPAAPYPNVPANTCFESINYNAATAVGSNVITNIPYTARFEVGWAVSGDGIPDNTTITSIDSSSQVHISNNATATFDSAALNFSGYEVSCFGAVPSILLPGGKILAGSLVNRSTYLYTFGTDSWAPSAAKIYDQSDEEGFTLESSGDVFTYDIFHSVDTPGSYAESYNPGGDAWSSISPSDGSALGTLPLLSSSSLGYELGAQLRLQDGRVFIIGANNATATYNPTTDTWAAGPLTTGTLNGNPAPFGQDDGPAAILPNGHVLFAADAGAAAVTSTGNTTIDSNVITNIPSTSRFQVGWGVAQTDGTNSVIPANAYITGINMAERSITISVNALATAVDLGLVYGGTYSQPTQLFDFNPAGAGTITPVSPALVDPVLATIGSYPTRMVLLPTGQVLFGDGSNQLYIYTGDGTASIALRPVINGISYNGSGVFTLTGKQLNGQSAGSSYGDDVQMDSNYPVLRMVNSVGKTYYCRTTDWSNVAVGTSSALQTVKFTLNPAMPAGFYSAIVSGAGISSIPVIVNITPAQVNGD